MAPIQLRMERGGPDLYRGGIKGGDKPSKGGDRQLEPCVKHFSDETSVGVAVSRSSGGSLAAT